MNHRLLLTAPVLSFAVLGGGTANAALLSYYDFNGLLSGAAPLTQNASQGSGQLVIVAPAAANVTSFGGTTANAVGTTPAGQALAIQAGTGGANNGATQTYRLSTTGFNNLALSYATQRTTTGFTTQSISFATSATGPFTAVDTPAFTIPTAFATRSVSLPAAAANQPAVFVRITTTGADATNASGNNRFDNVQFNAAAVASGNNTTLTATPGTVSLGRFIAGGVTPTATVTVTKTGTDTTGASVVATGAATASATGLAFTAANPNAQTFTVGVNGATPGAKTGTVVVDNLAVDSAGPGQGSADLDDAITVTGTAVASANASFDSVTDENAAVIDLGTLTQGGAAATAGVLLSNLASVFGASNTAGLDFDSFSVTGTDTASITFDGTLFTNLAAGSTASAGTVTLNSDTLGAFVESYTFALSDDDGVFGAAAQAVTLTVTGTVVAVVPEPATLALAAAGLALVGAGRPGRRTS